MPMMAIVHKVVAENCIFQERRLVFESFARILHACGPNVIINVFDGILAYELRGNPSFCPPNGNLPSSLFAIMSRGTALSTELFYALGRVVVGNFLRSSIGFALHTRHH